MKAENWMVREVYACRPETDLNEAARLMWEHDCGILPVVDAKDRVLGVLTDRDAFMGAYLQGKGLRELRVENSMSKQVFSCSPADPVEQVIRLMADNQVRRLPVIDKGGKLLGVISMNDLVRHLEELQDVRIRQNLSTRLVEALASICETRRSTPDVLEPVSRPAKSPLEV